MNETITAVVTGAGGVYGLGTVRNLRRANLLLRLVAADCNPTAAGLFLADVAAILPRADDPSYAARLSELCREQNAQIVFIAAGREIPLVAAQREALEEASGAVILVNSARLLAITEDKWATCRSLEAAELRTPPSTIERDTTALARFADEAGFPVIVKPRFGGGSRDVRRCDDLAQLIAAMTAEEDCIAQRLVGDDDHEYTVGVLGTEEGEILGSVTLRRYLKAGLTVAAEVVLDPDIAAYAEAATRHLRPRGYCNVQLRVDGDGPCAFEVNGRVSSSTGFRGLAGFNEPELLIRHYILGERVTAPEPERVRMVRAFDEFVVDGGRWEQLMGR